MNSELEQSQINENRHLFSLQNLGRATGAIIAAASPFIASTFSTEQTAYAANTSEIVPSHTIELDSKLTTTKKVKPAPESTVSYGTDPSQFIDVYPSSVPESHVVVLVHGGGFKSNPNSNLEVSTAKSLRNDGFTVFDTNYRGDDTTPAFPEEVQDIMSATEYAINNAASYNGNSAEITLLGGSSGGLLVSMAGITLNAFKANTVKSVVTLSGPSDFNSLLSYWSAIKGAHAEQHVKDELTALGCVSVASCSISTENTWSPDRQVTSTNCPEDYLIIESDGCKTDYDVFPDTKHSFSYFSTVNSIVSSFIESN